MRISDAVRKATAMGDSDTWIYELNRQEQRPHYVNRYADQLPCDLHRCAMRAGWSLVRILGDARPYAIDVYKLW